MKVVAIMLVLLAEKNPKWDVLSEVLNEINNTEETLKIGDSTPGKLFTSSYIQNYVAIVCFPIQAFNIFY